MSAYRCIVFDLDGTLVDSSHDIAAALNRVLAPLGGTHLTAAQVVPLLGEGVHRLVAGSLVEAGLAGTEAEVAEVAPLYVAAYEEHPVVETVLYPGVRQTLSELVAARVPLGVCTNKNEAIARQVLDGLGVADCFTSVVGGDRDVPRKPDPSHLLAVFDELGQSPASGALVGDSPIDQQTAARASVDFFAVEWAPADVGGARLTPFAQLVALVHPNGADSSTPQTQEM